MPSRLEDQDQDEAEDDQEQEEDALAPPGVLLVPAHAAVSYLYRTPFSTD